MVRTKVFVGNLSFKTKEPELRAQFSQAGNVIDVNIITRGPRSLGYGFVEMESEEAANAAITALHHKDVDGRSINVELAKEPKEGEEQQPREPRERKPRQPREPREPKAPRDNQGGDKDEADAAPKQRRPRERKPSTKSRDANEGENVRDGTQGSKPARDPKQPRPERVDRTTGQKKTPSEGADNKEKKPREPREPRPKKTNENRTESDTLLFVANLPFSLDNDTFTSFVTGHGIAVKQAYVVKKHNNRSKGYGFIEFNNAAEQKSALEKLSGLNIEDRPISVKIALTPPPSDETEGQSRQDAKPSASTSGGNVSSPKPVQPNTNKAEGVKSPKVEGTPAAASPKKEVKKEEKK